MARRSKRTSNRSPRGRAGASPRRRSRFWWARLSDDRLLDLRFKDLNLTIENTELEYYIARLYDELDRRGLKLGPPPPDPYARKLRTLAHEHPTPIRPPLGPLVDRLLVGCLIEARSCERFRLLADALAERGPEDLAKFYADLFAAEARHFRTFVDLANEVLGDRKAVRARLEQLAEGEGEIVARLVNEPEVHG